MENDNMKTKAGIGLYKIRYEMDVKGTSREQNYLAGVIAYTSEEAVNTLINFGKKKVKGFKGIKIEEVSFDGGCHAISDKVKNAVINGAITEGKIMKVEDHNEILLKEVELATKKAKKDAKDAKKSIIPTSKKDE